VTIIFAEDVGVRWSVMGCWHRAASEDAGFGRARTCERKFISKKRACSSMTITKDQYARNHCVAVNVLSQSVGVIGSMWTVCARGGSTCRITDIC